MTTVLIADDNAQISSILAEYAKREGYEPVIARDGTEALDAFRRLKPGLVLLDVMMPRMDGFEVCREIRKTSSVPVIMITARGEDFERIMGLDIGADDYIVKPFSPGEVMARVRAVMRRLAGGEGAKRQSLAVGSLSVDLDNYKASVNGQEVALTKRSWRYSGRWRPTGTRYSPGITCCPLCGGTIISGTAVRWIPTSSGCAPNWRHLAPRAGPSPPSGAWDTDLR